LRLLPVQVQTNFETTKSSADFAALYKRDALPGGHVIMLGPNCEKVSFVALYDTLLIADAHHPDGGETSASTADTISAVTSLLLCCRLRLLHCKNTLEACT
jgi:hypothetical protein